MVTQEGAEENKIRMKAAGTEKPEGWATYSAL